MPYPSDIHDSWDHFYDDEQEEPVNSLFDPEEWDSDYEFEDEEYWDDEE